MGTLGSEIAGHHRDGAGKLALHVEIPRLKIRVSETLVYGCRRKSRSLSPVDRVFQYDRARQSERRGQRRVTGRSRHDTGHWLVYKDPICASYRSLSVTEWVPCESQSWLNILIILLIDRFASAPESLEGRRCRVENDKAPVALFGRHVPVVPQAHLECEVRSPSVIVLREKAERPFSDAARLIPERHAECIGCAGQKCRDAGKVEGAGGHPEIVVEELPVLAADLEGVPAANAVQGIADDKRRVAPSRWKV